MNKRRWLIVLAYLVSGVLLAAVFARLDWDSFWAALAATQASWLVVAVGISVVDMMLRSLRWNIIAGRPLGQYWHFWRATTIGYLGNFIYPLRAGEVIRMAALKRLAGVPTGQAMSSALIDRVTDGCMLAVFLVVVIVIHSADSLDRSAVVGIIAAFALVAAGAALFVARGDRWDPGRLAWLARLPAGLGARLARWYAEALHVAAVFRRPSHLAAVVVLASSAVSADFLLNWSVMYAFGWELPFTAPITVVVFLWAGSALPAAPGYFGVYQVACVLSLSLYGIPASEAVAFSVVLQLLHLGVITAQGGWAALVYGVSLRLRNAQAATADDGP